MEIVSDVHVSQERKKFQLKWCPKWLHVTSVECLLSTFNVFEQFADCALQIWQLNLKIWQLNLKIWQLNLQIVQLNLQFVQLNLQIVQIPKCNQHEYFCFPSVVRAISCVHRTNMGAVHWIQWRAFYHREKCDLDLDPLTTNIRPSKQWNEKKLNAVCIILMTTSWELPLNALDRSAKKCQDIPNSAQQDWSICEEKQPRQNHLSPQNHLKIPGLQTKRSTHWLEQRQAHCPIPFSGTFFLLNII